MILDNGSVGGIGFVPSETEAKADGGTDDEDGAYDGYFYFGGVWHDTCVFVDVEITILVIIFSSCGSSVGVQCIRLI